MRCFPRRFWRYLVKLALLSTSAWPRGRPPTGESRRPRQLANLPAARGGGMAPGPSGVQCRGFGGPSLAIGTSLDAPASRKFQVQATARRQLVGSLTMERTRQLSNPVAYLNRPATGPMGFRQLANLPGTPRAAAPYRWIPCRGRQLASLPPPNTTGSRPPVPRSPPGTRRCRIHDGEVLTNKSSQGRADAQRLVATRLLDRLHDPLGHFSRLQRIYPRAR